jgi:hypothetical protein
MVIMPLPIEQCRAVVESRELPYPLYANPDWSVYEAFETGHVLHAPKQCWVGVDPGGDVRYLWRSGSDDDGRTRVPMPLDVLEAFTAALP